MIKIIDEIYTTIEDETDSEWITRFSIITKPGEGGYWKLPKLFNHNERMVVYEVGAAHYTFIFEEDGKVGTCIIHLEDSLFEDDDLYNARIDDCRTKILNGSILESSIKVNELR